MNEPNSPHFWPGFGSGPCGFCRLFKHTIWILETLCSGKKKKKEIIMLAASDRGIFPSYRKRD